MPSIYESTSRYSTDEVIQPSQSQSPENQTYSTGAFDEAHVQTMIVSNSVKITQGNKESLKDAFNTILKYQCSVRSLSLCCIPKIIKLSIHIANLISYFFFKYDLLGFNLQLHGIPRKQQTVTSSEEKHRG